MEKAFTCAEFEVLLADWIDETLAVPGREAQRAAFLGHLESCAACADLAEDTRFAIAFMDRAAEVETPPALVTKILHATNAGWEFKLRGRGLSGWINRTFAPVLRPRFAMSAAVTLISLTMMARGCGLPEKTFTAADLDPVRLWTSLDDRTHRIWVRTVKSYESMRLVYEVRNQINDWAQQQRQDDEARADAKADKRKLDSPDVQPKPQIIIDNRK
jgi:hypothetical protein